MHTHKSRNENARFDNRGPDSFGRSRLQLDPREVPRVRFLQAELRTHRSWPDDWSHIDRMLDEAYYQFR
jgi:hypothetical protein